MPEDIERSASLQVRNRVAVRHVDQLRIRSHGRVSHRRFGGFADIYMIQHTQVADLHIRLIKNLVDKCRICVILLVAQRFLGLRVLAGLKVRFARGQILGISEDKVAVIRRDDIGNIADVLQSHRARC